MDEGTDISTKPTGPAPEFAASVQPSYAWTVFFGPDGLRPGWGVAFYVAMFYLLQFSGQPVGWVGGSGRERVWSMMLDEFGVFVAAVIPALVLARVERRPWGVYGLPGRQAFGKLFWVGAVWGFASITLLLGTMYGLRVFDVGHLAMHGMRIVKFAAFLGGVFLAGGVVRGISVARLFAVHTYSGDWFLAGGGVALVRVWLDPLARMRVSSGRGLLAAAVIGFFFCLTLRRTGSLWFAVGFHAAWDWGETFVYSVPDSGTVFPGHLLKSSFHGPGWLTGGMVGPEGSVLCFVVIAVVWVAFARGIGK